MISTEFSTDWSQSDVNARLWAALLEARREPLLTRQEAQEAARRFLEAERRMIEATALAAAGHRLPAKGGSTDGSLLEATLESQECTREAFLAAISDGVRVQALVESLCPPWCDYHDRQHDHFGPRESGLTEWCREVLDPFIFHTRTFGDAGGACVTAHFRVGFDGTVTQAATCMDLETCQTPEDLEQASAWLLEAAEFVRQTCNQYRGAGVLVVA